MAIGFTERAVRYRIQDGRLAEVHPGVYAVGHSVLSRKGLWLAGVMSGSMGSVLSHRAAGAHWRVRADDRIEVTSPRKVRPRPGIQFHLSVLPFDEVTIHDGIPVTTVPRTVFDLAAVVPRHQVELAMRKADALRLYDALSVPDLLDHYPGRRGTATLRAILDDRNLGEGIPRSRLETSFHSLIAKSNLPAPELNGWVKAANHWYECDCVWRSARLIVELDSRQFHADPVAFEADRERDRLLKTAGWTVVRLTWRQLHTNPAQVVADLRCLLG